MNKVVITNSLLLISILADPTHFTGSSNEAKNYKVTACSVCASVVLVFFRGRGYRGRGVQRWGLQRRGLQRRGLQRHRLNRQ